MNLCIIAAIAISSPIRENKGKLRVGAQCSELVDNADVDPHRQVRRY